MSPNTRAARNDVATRLISRLRGWPALSLVIASILYGVVIISVLPMWSEMATAAGGTELQERFGYSATEARQALAGIKANAGAAALTFYALDVPNAVLYALGLAAMIAFGLRQLNAGTSVARLDVYLPIAAGAADLAENALLASALLAWPNVPDLLLAAAGVLTTVKLGIGLISQVLAVALVVAGVVAIVWRRRNSRTQA